MTCLYRHKQGAHVFCTRNPPQVFMGVVDGPRGPQPAVQATYPLVNPSIPCGEYERSELFASEQVGMTQ